MPFKDEQVHFKGNVPMDSDASLNSPLEVIFAASAVAPGVNTRKLKVKDGELWFGGATPGPISGLSVGSNTSVYIGPIVGILTVATDIIIVPDTALQFIPEDQEVISLTTQNGLTENTPYYIKKESATTFKLRSAPGGSTIDFTGSDDASFTLVIQHFKVQINTNKIIIKATGSTNRNPSLDLPDAPIGWSLSIVAPASQNSGAEFFVYEADGTTVAFNHDTYTRLWVELIYLGPTGGWYNNYIQIT